MFYVKHKLHLFRQAQRIKNGWNLELKIDHKINNIQFITAQTFNCVEE